MNDMDDGFVRALGQEIQSWRRLRKMSREDLAKAVDVSETTVGRIEREGPVDVAVTWRIATALGLSFADLVRRAEEMAAMDPMNRNRPKPEPRKRSSDPVAVDWSIKYRGAPDVSEAEDNMEDLYDEPSAAHPVPRHDVEGDVDPDLQL